MPVVGPSFQAHPAQNSQIAMGYPGFGTALPPNGQHVSNNNHGAMITPPQFAGAPGPGYVINNTNNGNATTDKPIQTCTYNRMLICCC